MIKKILIVIIIVIALLITGVYIYRQTIIQYYAEKIVRENLPPYIKIDKIRLDFSGGSLVLSGFKLLNPPDFAAEFLLEIKELSCRYRIKGGFIPEGLEISDILVKSPNLEVERLRDGRINLVEEEKYVKGFPAGKAGSRDPGAGSNGAIKKFTNGRKMSDIIKLPPSFNIKGGRVVFLDKLPYNRPHLITIDDINGDVTIGFDENYSKILSLAFTLDGILNDTSNETIRWTAALNPLTPRITMSNRFDVSGLDIVAFEPYYEKLSPFIFKKGKFSGALVFDFDNGNIGSTNEVHLSHYIFYVKPGYENANMWETSVPDLVSYFTSPSGEIVFDFKLKGDMNSPQFYLGPISKRALTSMALNKISSYAIKAVTKQADGVTQGVTGGSTEDYINLIKGLINKK